MGDTKISKRPSAVVVDDAEPALTPLRPQGWIDGGFCLDHDDPQVVAWVERGMQLNADEQEETMLDGMTPLEAAVLGSVLACVTMAVTVVLTVVFAS